MNRRKILTSSAWIAMAIGTNATRVEADQPDTKGSKTMANANEAVVRYLAAWNERDAKRRRDLVAKTWTDDGTYVDRAREGRGHDGISEMVGKAQAHFPGYVIRLASGIETHNLYVRFSWIAGGSPDAPLYIKGTDFGLMADDGRFKSVVGFVDAAPAQA